jgi:hypothetical protein
MAAASERIIIPGTPADLYGGENGIVGYFLPVRKDE